MAKAREFRKLKAKRKKAKKENKKFKRSGQNYLTHRELGTHTAHSKATSEKPVEYCKLLLDANIIKDIFFAHVDAGARLKNYLEKKPSWGNDFLFLALDRVITEFKNMAKRKFAEEFEYAQVCGQLSSLGRFQDDKLDTRAKYAHRAEELCKSEKYIGRDEKPLSLVDCYLLEYAIEYSCKLVTRDYGLIDATKKEIRLRLDESKLTGATSPGVFNPNRT
jgi:predicted nucleic acid-binding protein